MEKWWGPNFRFPPAPTPRTIQSMAGHSLPWVIRHIHHKTQTLLDLIFTLQLFLRKVPLTLHGFCHSQRLLWEEPRDAIHLWNSTCSAQHQISAWRVVARHRQATREQQGSWRLSAVATSRKSQNAVKLSVINLQINYFEQICTF